jgi:hypothetical protein
MGSIRKVVGWVLVVLGVFGTLDRLGYFPTAWFSNPIRRVVDFFSANLILYFLYLVFPLIMLILGLTILTLEIMHSEEKRKLDMQASILHQILFEEHTQNKLTQKHINFQI